MNQNARKFVCAAVLAWLWVCSGASAEILNFTANLDGVCAATSSTATGSGTFSLDTATGLFQYNIEYSGLSSTEENAHIHGPIAQACGSLGGGLIVVTLPLGTPKIGGTIFNAQQQADLIAGLYYVNIHTVNFGTGEISGVILLDIPVPAASEWGIVVLVLLLLSAGTVVLRMRRSDVCA